MPLNYATVDAIKQRVITIDERLEQEIAIVNQKLDQDIIILEQAAQQEIDKLKHAAESDRAQEVTQATQEIESETQILISQIQDI